MICKGGLPRRFLKREYDLGGRTRCGTESIPLPTHSSDALRRYTTVMVEVIAAQVDPMLKANLIELAQSKCAFNVVMVRKSDGSLRFFVD